MHYSPTKRGTILIPSCSKHHLHFICNDPVFYPNTGKNSALLVNISSIKPNIPYDKTCELDDKDHPFITKPSFIYYRMAGIYSISGIQQQVMAGNYSIKEDCDQAVFNKILNGFANSEDVPLKIFRFYEKFCR